MDVADFEVTGSVKLPETLADIWDGNNPESNETGPTGTKDNPFFVCPISASKPPESWNYDPAIHGGGLISVLERPVGLDTGGYTGEWGAEEGRLALLHKKELVLNEDDTSHILSAVSIVRSLQESLDNSVAARMTAMNSSYNSALSNFMTNNSEVAQNIVINAEFPDATDAQEIKEAFSLLVNMAN